MESTQRKNKLTSICDELFAEFTRLLLNSIPGMGVQAAALIATIGTIANFESPAQLKSYFGWVPKIAQSGSTLDWSRLTPRGVRCMRQTMYLIVWRAITMGYRLERGV